MPQQYVGERTRAERDAELRETAVDVDAEGDWEIIFSDHPSSAED